ncbi:hypothetical protein KIW84_045187 [Lathyrus oleraceus]|uniref:Uncharacterized protein n=1 Tax=Pisum sativum TaxID=3888 RepID=A0A9D4XMN8_PEA|nr:hypothetical protein KIW84_045187 [Pisum sativum]
MGDQPVTGAYLEGITMTFTTELTALTECMENLTNQMNNSNNKENQGREMGGDHIRVDILLFYGTTGMEEFLYWKIYIDRFFDVMGVHENKRIRDPEGGSIHQWLKGIFEGEYIFTNSYSKESSATTSDSNPINKGASSAIDVQHGKTPVHRKNNPYSKPTGDTCYCCNGRGHGSNVYPTRKFFVVAEERDVKEVEFSEEEFD